METSVFKGWKDNRKAIHKYAGRGCQNKRMPSCNQVDRGFKICPIAKASRRLMQVFHRKKLFGTIKSMEAIEPIRKSMVST